eukprot:scaffold135_cov249-Pinguiococcus_pyrenoidosus.AAC.4
MSNWSSPCSSSCSAACWASPVSSAVPLLESAGSDACSADLDGLAPKASLAIAARREKPPLQLKRALDLSLWVSSAEAEAARVGLSGVLGPVSPAPLFFCESSRGIAVAFHPLRRLSGIGIREDRRTGRGQRRPRRAASEGSYEHRKLAPLGSETRGGGSAAVVDRGDHWHARHSMWRHESFEAVSRHTDQTRCSALRDWLHRPTRRNAGIHRARPCSSGALTLDIGPPGTA